MANILKKTNADENHNVVTIEGMDSNRYMKKPCRNCPWKKSAVGEFPAEAFRISAHTSYDMSESMFGCHQSGTKKPSTCAGFLLNGSAHNLNVRLKLMKGHYDLSKVSDGGDELFESYKSMAIDNGVEADDPCLKESRS